MKNEKLSELGYNQLPHYSTHAIEAMHFLAKQLPIQFGVPADFELLLAELLQESVKFLLPDNGDLFAKEHDYKPSMFDLLRLPYPVCALEFTATAELHAAGTGLLHAAKRIALCFDPWQLSPRLVERINSLCGRSFLEKVPPRCLAVMAVFETSNVWSAAVGVVLIDLVNDKPLALKGSELPLGFGDVGARVGELLGSGKRMAHGLPVTFVTFPGRAALTGQGPDEAVECLYIDTIDEVRVVYEFLAAINCANVGTQEVGAPKALNERRKKKGKPLFYPYKLLDLTPAASSSGDGGPLHASPRTHLRRGHLRHLGERFDHKVLWINATLVNAKSGEDPTQVYKVRAGRRSGESAR